jgi:hypothetical protein
MRAKINSLLAFLPNEFSRKHGSAVRLPTGAL